MGGSDERIFARYQEKNISLKEMAAFRSCDTDLNGQCERELPGLTAADNASYLGFLIAQSVRLNPDFYKNEKDLDGEVLLFFGEDTGTRDKDGQPVVKPKNILTRMPVSDFIDFDGIKNGGDVYGGKEFLFVQDVLNRSNDTEKEFQKKMKRAGIDPIKTIKGKENA